MEIKEKKPIMVFEEIETYNNGTIITEYIINKRVVNERTFFKLKQDQFDNLKNVCYKKEVEATPKVDETIKDIALSNPKFDNELSDFIDELFQMGAIEAQEKLKNFINIIMNREYYYGYLRAMTIQQIHLDTVIRKLKES